MAGTDAAPRGLPVVKAALAAVCLRCSGLLADWAFRLTRPPAREPAVVEVSGVVEPQSRITDAAMAMRADLQVKPPVPVAKRTPLAGSLAARFHRERDW